MSATGLFWIQHMRRRLVLSEVEELCPIYSQRSSLLRLVGSWIAREAQWFFLFSSEKGRKCRKWQWMVLLHWKELPEVSWHAGLGNIEFIYFSHTTFEFCNLIFKNTFYVYIPSHWVFQLPFLSIRDTRSGGDLSHKAEAEREADSQDWR